MTWTLEIGHQGLKFTALRRFDCEMKGGDGLYGSLMQVQDGSSLNYCLVLSSQNIHYS
jgi:hypothetical protein